MAQVWTLARWVAKRGQEEAFVQAWSEMAQWTLREFPDAQGTLLRDRDETHVFYSFGPWADADAAATWRESAGFTERMRRVRALLDDFQPHLLDHVTTASNG